MADTFKPTSEQLYAIELAQKNNGSVKIEAFAGTGKTTTLKAIGEAKGQQSGLYIAFNKSIADHAAKTFPGRVDCRTAHSLAFRQVGCRYRERLQQKLTAQAVTQELGHGHWNLFKNDTLSHLAIATVNRFCHGDSYELTKYHTPRDMIKTFEKPGIDIEHVGEVVLAIAKKLWAAMLDESKRLPVTHDFYLKLWSLGNPRVYCDYVMLDEAQDANPLLLKILKSLGKPIIFVGDAYQQIYSWRGAINAMNSIDSASTAKLTQSFRFGQEIADAANEVLELLKCESKIRGNPKIKSVIKKAKDPKAILCRTNSGTIDQLIDALGRGKKPALAGGTKEISALVKAMEDIRKGRGTMHPELMLIQTWDQLEEFVDTEMGAEIKSVFDLVESHGAESLMHVFAQVAANNEAHCDMIISTAHKAKGREWDSVLLAGDFKGPESKGYRPEEGNLFYVALTRAINQLDLSECDILDQIERKKIEEEEEKRELERAKKQLPASGLELRP